MHNAWKKKEPHKLLFGNRPYHTFRMLRNSGSVAYALQLNSQLGPAELPIHISTSNRTHRLRSLPNPTLTLYKLPIRPPLGLLKAEQQSLRMRIQVKCRGTAELPVNPIHQSVATNKPLASGHSLQKLMAKCSTKEGALSPAYSRKKRKGPEGQALYNAYELSN